MAAGDVTIDSLLFNRFDRVIRLPRGGSLPAAFWTRLVVRLLTEATVPNAKDCTAAAVRFALPSIDASCRLTRLVGGLLITVWGSTAKVLLHRVMAHVEQLKTDQVSGFGRVCIFNSGSNPSSAFSASAAKVLSRRSVALPSTSQPGGVGRVGEGGYRQSMRSSCSGVC
jgi:hypothetical protein